MKVLKVFLVVIGVAAVGFLVTGLATPKEFRGQLSVKLPCSKVKIWDALSDIEHLPQHRKEITKVEILGLSNKGYHRWKEYTGHDQYMIFELTNQEYEKRMTVTMTESTFGMTGSWTYLLEGADSTSTNFTVIEDSKIDDLFVRAMVTMTGRGRFLKHEVSDVARQVGASQ